MDNIIVMPYKIRNYYYHSCCTVREECVRIGGDCEHNVYKCQLFFNIPIYNIQNSIKKAVLRMFCSTQNTSSATAISAQVVETDSSLFAEIEVNNSGWYEWDLTEMIQELDKAKHFSIYLFTNCCKYCEVKTFCSHLSSHPISLQLTTEDYQDRNTYEYKEEYLVSLEWKYSKWLSCSSYKNYVYHVYNKGEASVEIIVNISPDKEHYTQSGIIYTVAPSSLIVIEPMQYSFYIRTAFKNTAKSEKNPIKLWFQAQK